MHALSEIFQSMTTRRNLSVVLFVVFDLLIIWIAFSSIFSYLERRDEIDQLRASIATLSMSVRRPKFDISPPALDVKSINIFSKNPEESINHVQRIIRSVEEAIGPNGVRIDSVRVLPSLEENSLVASRVSVAMTTSGEYLFDIINMIEVATPAIVIDNVRIGNRTISGLLQRDVAAGTSSTGYNMKNKMNLTLKTYSQKMMEADKLKGSARNPPSKAL